MSIPNSVLAELMQALPIRPQIYFKSSLTALSHAMEDQVLADSEQPLVIASFQRERFYRQEAHRYRRIAEKSDHVYILAAPETDFTNSSQDYETIAFEPTDSLAHEWHLVVIGQQFVSCLVCQERSFSSSEADEEMEMDNSRRFDGIWTFDRQVSNQAAAILLKQIVEYRPELAKKVKQAQKRYLRPQGARERERRLSNDPMSNPDPFVQRLVTYLQAGQYKLIKANCSLATKQQQEQLLNSVIAAMRRSLNPHEILQVAVEKLGEGLKVCRCIVYRCKETDEAATIQHEFLSLDIRSLKGQTWSLQDNPFFQEVVKNKESLSIADVPNDPRFQSASEALLALEQDSIVSWFLVPVLYQDRLMGMIELHHCQANPLVWKDEEINLVNAIATQIGVALIQAEAYANLEDLNEQLEALDRTRSNLVAITGHELRTPLSTIQVCLESLASEPDMSPELKQVMLNTALTDAERMRKLVQDFLTLSQLESGRIEWHPEALSLQECIDLSLSHIRAHNAKNKLPQIHVSVLPELPLVRADGEWLVEVLSKLLDNACKFTGADGQVTIQISRHNPQNLEVTIADTGRGIEPNRLESVFDRFYQEEGALRRSAGGTGLGLAICRQIVNGWGGEIWAESAGKNHGSQFHFTLPIVNPSTNVGEADNNGHRTTSPRRGRRQKKQ